MGSEGREFFFGRGGERKGGEAGVQDRARQEKEVRAVGGRGVGPMRGWFGGDGEWQVCRVANWANQRGRDGLRIAGLRFADC